MFLLIRWLAWQGKVFDGRRGELVNKVSPLGIKAFKAQVARYTGAGFEVELQVRYHPPQGAAGSES